MNWCLAVCVPMRTLRFSSPSGSKCHHLQCLLLRAKANALRLNELSLTDFMHIMALTPTRLRKNRVHTGTHTARHHYTYCLLYTSQLVTYPIFPLLLRYTNAATHIITDNTEPAGAASPIGNSVAGNSFEAR